MNLKKPLDLTVRIPSDKEFLSLVMDVSEDLSKKMGFDNTKVRKIRAAVCESCTNAIEHGNKNDPDKEVLIVFRIEQTKLQINVTDQGGGFDIQKVATPSADDMIKNPELSKRGWGLFLIKKYVDELHFDESGNLGLTLIIYLQNGKEKNKEE